MKATDTSPMTCLTQVLPLRLSCFDAGGARPQAGTLAFPHGSAVFAGTA